MTYDYVVHGNMYDYEADEDNEEYDGAEADVCGDLEDIVSFKINDPEDFKAARESISDDCEIDRASLTFDHTLSNTIDDLDDIYYWYNHNNGKGQDKKQLKADFNHDHKIINDYIDDYKNSGWDLGSLLSPDDDF